MTSTFLEGVKKFVTVQPEKKRLKILLVTPELTPYASVGGLGMVMSALSRALLELGHDVRLFMPKFGLIDERKHELKMVYEGLAVPTAEKEGPKELICNVKIHKIPERVLVYFLENMEYYEKRANVYGYSDDSLRWALLSRGALEFLLISDWLPDVIHASDWQTGHIPNYLRTDYSGEKRLLHLATVFTIHNLQFQGMFDHRMISETDFDDGHSKIASFLSERLGKQNFMRRGIMYADAINTVSEAYAKEILGSEFGDGLDRLLLEMRSKLFGITNGIDYQEFNPATDELIAANYDANSIEERVKNKTALQKEFDLPQDENIPVLAICGRLDPQKGDELAGEILWPLLRNFEVQFIRLGGGDVNVAEIYRELQRDFPAKVGLHLMPNFTLPRLIFSGSDIMLFPSKFEPCGIVQLEAMRYGAIPVARAVGGLADTIENFDPVKNTGTGFLFKDYDKWQFFAQVIRALEVYNHKNIWSGIVRRAMLADHSWQTSAKKYVKLYRRALTVHNQELISAGLPVTRSREDWLGG